MFYRHYYSPENGVDKDVRTQRSVHMPCNTGTIRTVPTASLATRRAVAEHANACLLCNLRRYVGDNCDDKSAVWQIIDGVIVIHMTKWMNITTKNCASAVSQPLPRFFFLV